MNTKDITEAWAKIREKDNSIPDDVLDFMKDSAIAALSSTPAGEDVTKLAEALDACFGVMMQVSLNSVNSRSEQKWSVSVHESIFLEARARAEKMYYEAKKGYKAALQNKVPVEPDWKASVKAAHEEISNDIRNMLSTEADKPLQNSPVKEDKP